MPSTTDQKQDVNSDESSHDQWKQQLIEMDQEQRRRSKMSQQTITPQASHDVSPHQSSFLPSPPLLSPQKPISIYVKSPLRNEDFSLACNFISRNPTNLTQNGGGFSSYQNHKKDVHSTIFTESSSDTPERLSLNQIKISQASKTEQNSDQKLLNIPEADGQFQIHETFGRVIKTELEQEESKEEVATRCTPRLHHTNSNGLVTMESNPAQVNSNHNRTGSQGFSRPFSSKGGSLDMSTEQTRAHSRVGSLEVRMVKGIQNTEDLYEREREKIEEESSEESQRSEENKYEGRSFSSISQFIELNECSPIQTKSIINYSKAPGKSRNLGNDDLVERPSKSRMSQLPLDQYYHGVSSNKISISDYGEESFYALTPRDNFNEQRQQFEERTGHLRIPRFESGSSGLTRVLQQSTKMHSVDENIVEQKALPSIIFKYGRFSVNAAGFPHMLSQSEEDPDPESQIQQTDGDGHHDEEQEFKVHDLALNKGIILKQALMQQRNVFKMREAELAYFSQNYGQYYFKLESISDGMRLKSRDTITPSQMLSLQMASLLSNTFRSFSQLRDSPFLRFSPSSSIIDTKGPYLTLISNLQKVMREIEALCPYASVAHLFVQVKNVDKPNSKSKWLLPFQRRSYKHTQHRLKLKKRPSVALANDIISLLEAVLNSQRKAGFQTSRTPASLDTPGILNNSWRGRLNIKEREIESIYREQDKSGLQFALLPNFFQICKDDTKLLNSSYQILRKVGKKCQSEFGRVSRRHYFWNTVCLPLFEGVNTFPKDDIVSSNSHYQRFEVTDAVVLLFIGQHRTQSNLSKKDVLGRKVEEQREEKELPNEDILKEGSLQIGLQMDKITEFMKEFGDILILHRNLLVQAAAAYIGTVISEKRKSLRPRR